MDTDNLCRLQKNDSEKLSHLLTDCFAQDPLYCKLIPKKEMRNKMLPEIFTCDLDEMFQNCEVYADSKDVNGIIVVSDETTPYNPVKYYWTEFFYTLKTSICLIKDDPSLHTLSNFIKGHNYLNEEWTNHINQDQRVHIIYFAVRPQMRGKGIATKLMQPVLNYADRNKLLTSLETHNEKNVSMYQHYGFKVFETVTQNSDLKQFCMVR